MKATSELNKPWCVSVFKDNAGIVQFDNTYNICFRWKLVITRPP